MHVRLAAKADGPQCRAFYAAIRKHGAHAFTHEVLEMVETRDAANEAETRWIAALGSLAPKGYNMQIGGAVRTPHPDTIAKLCASQRRKWARYSPERRAALGQQLVNASTREMRSAAGKRAWDLLNAEERHAAMVRRGKGVSSEKQAAKGRSVWIGKTPEERSAMVLKSWATRRARETQRREQG